MYLCTHVLQTLFCMCSPLSSGHHHNVFIVLCLVCYYVLFFQICSETFLYQATLLYQYLVLYVTVALPLNRREMFSLV